MNPLPSTSKTEKKAEEGEGRTGVKSEGTIHPRGTGTSIEQLWVKYIVGKTYGECLKRKIRGYEGGQGGMAQRGCNMAYLAFILRPKLHGNGLCDWKG